MKVQGHRSLGLSVSTDDELKVTNKLFNVSAVQLS